MIVADRALTATARVCAALHFHARLESPRECCGLLLGNASYAWEMEPLSNESNVPGRFQASTQLIAARRRARQCGLRIVGVYHSHPTEPARFSQFDLFAGGPCDWAMVLVSIMDAPLPDGCGFAFVVDTVN